MKYNWNWGIFWQPAADGSGTWLDYLLRRRRLDARHRARGLGDRARDRLARRGDANHAEQVGGPARQRLRRVIPQRPAARPDVPLVLRAARDPAQGPRRRDQADAAAVGAYIPAVLCLGFYTAARVAEQVRAGIQSLPRGQRWRARRWGSPSRRPTASCCCRGVPDRAAAAHARVPEHHQEQLGRADDRPGGDHRAGALDAGVHLPGLRGVHGGDRSCTS